MDEPRSLGQYIWQSLKRRLGVYLLALVPAIGVVLLVGEGAWNWIDRILTPLTLFMAGYIWWMQQRQEWLEYLPNRLTVHFYHNDKEVMRCEKAHLTAESDIRALAQQIGLQMAGENLNFVAPAIEFSPPDLGKEGKYNHYTVKIELTKLPSRLKNSNNSTNQILIWQEPFRSKPKWQNPTTTEPTRL